MYYDFELGNASYDAPLGKVEGEITLKRTFKYIRPKDEKYSSNYSKRTK
jgi:DNA helicase-2/ATP-dependent DNA helicase PcrA